MEGDGFWLENGDECRMGRGLTKFLPTDGDPPIPPPGKKPWHTCISVASVHLFIYTSIFQRDEDSRKFQILYKICSDFTSILEVGQGLQTEHICQAQGTKTCRQWYNNFFHEWWQNDIKYYPILTRIAQDLPVALQYTTLALGSCLCSSNTVRPVLVGLDDPAGQRFLALWHSSRII